MIPGHLRGRRRHGRAAATLVVAALLGLLGVGLLATPGQAHARLVETDPKDGARLTKAPASVRLTFTDQLDPAFVQVRVAGPLKALPARPVTQGRSVTVRVTSKAAGRYTVVYRVVSRDGHPVSGSVSFTVLQAAPSASGTATGSTRPSTTPTAKGGPASSGASGSVTGTPGAATGTKGTAGAGSTGSTGSAAGADDGSGSSLPLVIGAIVVVALGLGGLAWFVTHRGGTRPMRHER